ncbi:3-keto-disaccharide hydrolase [Stratiformator vulcanicus]|uniref:3-keto-alpha-glucoside-1,2-lyase/3-keto-2-hydroxy-glucal hydratase domain-containing protein n=1 Tax=Stratiformator vulcanicus TaxID=2527980 RepID=A0A517R2G6_9PLAN|nr:DUF1080 domain-containing protein [Stratiformator vulcanicus]QDT38051.1 hypothetical protein Pan189_24360 [Stratiformator vulcanicus]
MSLRNKRRQPYTKLPGWPTASHSTYWLITGSVFVLVGIAGCGQEAVDESPTKESPTVLATKDAAQSADTSAAWHPIALKDVEQGWIALFDGRTQFGWSANSETNWRIDDGEIVADEGDVGLLRTTTQFADYEFRCECRLAEGGNSGVFLRTTADPESPIEGCYEFNLCDQHDTHPTGSLVGRNTPTKPFQLGTDWHTVSITLSGNRITAKIDETVVLENVEVEGETRSIGYIGLQHNKGQVRFRNVALKPLALTTLDESDDWEVVPGSKGQATVQEEQIKIEGGPGFLQTTETFGDFVLQLNAETGAEDVNSGVFFRAEKGTTEAPSNGYEMQVQFTTDGGDRTNPDDYGDGFGAGAIFRRQAARYVNGSDFNPVYFTLIANGPHIASWVDGLQVTDFVDEREPDSNPRKGRRLDPGHLSLQGHDPGTKIVFRTVGIKELPK